MVPKLSSTHRLSLQRRDAQCCLDRLERESLHRVDWTTGEWSSSVQTRAFMDLRFGPGELHMATSSCLRDGPCELVLDKTLRRFVHYGSHHVVLRLEKSSRGATYRHDTHTGVKLTPHITPGSTVCYSTV